MIALSARFRSRLPPRKLPHLSTSMRTHRTSIFLLACTLALSSSADAQRPAEPVPAPRGRIQGVVYDSVNARPLGRATVQIVSTTAPSLSRAVIADSLGRFRIDSLDTGMWLLGVQHPLLDSLGIEQLSRVVNVTDRGTARTTLAVPSARALITRVCGAATAADASGFVRGTLRDASSGMPIAKGFVQVKWIDLMITKRGTERTIEEVDATADENGQFVACGVPTDGFVQLRAWRGTDSSGVLQLITPTHGILPRDFYIGASSRVMLTVSAASVDSAGDSLSAVTVMVARGIGQLQGSVRRKGGPPVGGARVAVRGSGLEFTTGEDGTFRLSALPLGTFTLETRAVGFAPHEEPIDILANTTPIASVALDRLTMLDTVKIKARYRAVGLEAFEKRRRSGFGRYLGPDDIEKRNAFRLSDLFVTMPSVRVVNASDGDQILMRGNGFQRYCTPTFFIDGMRTFGGTEFVMASSVRAIEVYTSSTAPVEFTDLNGCGSIVVWTGRR